MSSSLSACCYCVFHIYEVSFFVEYSKARYTHINTANRAANDLIHHSTSISCSSCLSMQLAVQSLASTLSWYVLVLQATTSSCPLKDVVKYLLLRHCASSVLCLVLFSDSSFSSGYFHSFLTQGLYALLFFLFFVLNPLSSEHRQMIYISSKKFFDRIWFKPIKTF